ncbi:MAG: proton-conducting transporter membrane subunit, partial [Verrucomicrobiota bacterium]
ACAPQRSDVMTIHPINAISMNLGSYTMMTLLAFFVLTVVRAQLGGEDLSTFKGLGKRSPFLAFALMIAVAALAGIPLTSGFFGKFFVFRIAVQAEQWLLLGIAILAAGAGFYYYFKVVKAMYFGGADLPDDTPKLKVGALQRVVMLVLIVGILIFGFNPRPLLNLPDSGPASVTAVAD